MTKVLYLSAYQYSGSTLTSFLLNTHPDVATIGHTGGWPFEEGTEFYCSCGELIQRCPFYARIKSSFDDAGLPFDYRNFGTTFKVSSNPRLNRYLTASPPLVESTKLEAARNRIVSAWPPMSRKLSRQLRANEVLIQTALKHHGARVFVDNSLSPYRVPLLKRSKILDVMNLHLIRDPHGVANSCRRHHGWAPAQSTRLWLRHQRDIYRLSANAPTIVIHYDDICSNTNESINRIFSFVGLAPHDFAGDFKDSEHHILGNQMRLGTGNVKLDTRWRDDLSAQDIDAIQTALKEEASRRSGSPISEMLARYIH